MNNQLLELTKPLSKDDIEIRVGSCSKKGASFLLYKTARVDTKRFNAVFGLKWKREHRIESGYHICRISVFDEEIKEWVYREDVGTESNTEKEKGAFSDSFKRAGFSFGLGIELYEAPFIFIKDITEGENGKYRLKDPFYTKHLEIIRYDYSTESGLQLEIYNKDMGKTVFSNYKTNTTNLKPDTKTTHTQLTKNTNSEAITPKAENGNSFEELKQQFLDCTVENFDSIYEKIKKHFNHFTKEQQTEFANIKKSIQEDLSK